MCESVLILNYLLHLSFCLWKLHSDQSYLGAKGEPCGKWSFCEEPCLSSLAQGCWHDASEGCLILLWRNTSIMQSPYHGLVRRVGCKGPCLSSSGTYEASVSTSILKRIVWVLWKELAFKISKLCVATDVVCLQTKVGYLFTMKEQSLVFGFCT